MHTYKPLVSQPFRESIFLKMGQCHLEKMSMSFDHFLQLCYQQQQSPVNNKFNER